MADRPILFSGSMVRAILEGTKTQTRRVVKNPATRGYGWTPFKGGDICASGLKYVCGGGLATPKCPYALDDRLWVRETWSGPHAWSGTAPSKWSVNDLPDAAQRARHAEGNLWYWADGNPEYGDWTRPIPSIHMPRWASRLTLIVTDVRVQRLQDISEDDARAEGVRSFVYDGCGVFDDYELGEGTWQHTAKASFASLWNRLNAKRGLGWDSNPWIVAVTFDAEQRNIDTQGENDG